MGSNSYIVIAIVFLIALLIKLIKSSDKGPNLYELAQLRPYISKAPLTPTEITFYRKLVEALPDLLVFPQVQLSSFIKVDSSQIDKRDTRNYFNPISQQSVDYLICSTTFTIVAAVELDDRSHLMNISIQRDNKKTSNLSAANIPLIRWHAESMPTKEEIQQELLKITAPVLATSSEEWALDGPAYYLDRRPKTDFGLPIVVIGALLLGAIIWGGNLLGKSRPLTDSIQSNPLTQFIQPKPNLAIENLIAKQKLDQEMQINAKKAALATKQHKIRQEQQILIQEAQEATLKEDTWNRYYKKSVECETTGSTVTCGNDYIRNKRRFEQDWANRKRVSN